MKQSTYIEPRDSSLTPPSLPDRSDLAALYSHPVLKKVPQKQNGKPRAQSSYTLLTVIAANACVVLPYIASFISIAEIFARSDSSGVLQAAENRVTIILLTIPALLPWIVGIRLLSNILASIGIKLLPFITLYSFFIFPMLAICLTLRASEVADWVLLLCTFIASQLYVLVAIHSLSRSPHRSRFGLLITPILILVLATILIQS